MALSGTTGAGGITGLTTSFAAVFDTSVDAVGAPRAFFVCASGGPVVVRVPELHGAAGNGITLIDGQSIPLAFGPGIKKLEAKRPSGAGELVFGVMSNK